MWMGLRENDKNYVPCVHPQVGDTAERFPRGLPKLRLQLLAKETECSREEEADSD